jgi:hypothetical protein
MDKLCDMFEGSTDEIVQRGLLRYFAFAVMLLIFLLMA